MDNDHEDSNQREHKNNTVEAMDTEDGRLRMHFLVNKFNSFLFVV